MIKPIITAEEAVQMVQSGDTLVIGGQWRRACHPRIAHRGVGKTLPVNASAARPDSCSHQRHGGSGGARLGTPRRPTPD